MHLLDCHHRHGCSNYSHCSRHKHLSEDKELQNKLRNDRSLLPAPIEEMIRLHVPYRGFSRTAVNKEEISGTKVPPEEPITVVCSAANRDPEQFPNPHKFILNRDNIHTHLGFGKGIHRCPGMTRARMVLKIFLETIVDKCSDWDRVWRDCLCKAARGWPD
jgi:cytochrome P450